jgi:hypothetical protein
VCVCINVVGCVRLRGIIIIKQQCNAFKDVKLKVTFTVKVETLIVTGGVTLKYFTYSYEESKGCIDIYTTDSVHVKPEGDDFRHMIIVKNWETEQHG